MKWTTWILGALCVGQLGLIGWFTHELKRERASHWTVGPAQPIADPRQRYIEEHRERITGRAEVALADWLANQPEADRHQIDGAEVDTIQWVDHFLYVRLMKDNQQGPGLHLHHSFFHVLMEPNRGGILWQQRGPDEME